MNQARDRNWYYRTLQAAKRELGMNDDAYRSVLYGCGAKLVDDKFSAKTMSIPQLEIALNSMQQSGFKLRGSGNGGNGNSRFSPREKQLWLIKKLWGELHKAGVMHQPFGDKTLLNFASRHNNGVSKIEWLNATVLAKVIEALKNIKKRERV